MPSLLWQLHHSDEGGSNLEISAPSSSRTRQQGNDSRRTTTKSKHHHDESRRTGSGREGKEELEEEEEEQEQEEEDGVQAAAAPPASRRSSKTVYTRPGELPGLDSAFASFLDEHPSFQSTTAVDDTREADYPHLRAANRACFDYCGFGLFSFTQRYTAGQHRSNFSLVSAATSGSLAAQAAFSTSEPNTLQSELRSRVLDYLNVGDGSYSAVFTASKRAAFGLVADCYDFRSRSKLVTVYDHDSESVKALTTAAVRAGAKTSAARFRWPTLRLCGDQLAAELKSRGKGSRLLKKKTGGGAAGTAGGRRRGLFVFPTQSRITGTKYSYQWMTMAEKHRWDVLLDVSAMGPRDMGSLGLSLFRPDFIICSFYKVFGSDPTGFGVLLVKDSSLASLRSTNSSSLGVVKLVPDLGDDEFDGNEESDAAAQPAAAAAKSDLIAFSGPVLDHEVSSSAGSSFPFGSAEVECEEEEEEDGEQEGFSFRNGDSSEFKNTNGFGAGSSSRECSSEIQEVNDHAGSSSSSSVLSADDASCSYAQEHRDRLAALPNGDTSDSVFRKIGRDDGLIDSRRSDLFPRFLPIREEEEDEDYLDQSLGVKDEQLERSSTAIDHNSSSRSFNTSGRRSWRKNSSSWDGEADYYDDDLGSDEAWDEEELDEDLTQRDQQQRIEPLIICQGLDYANTMGLNKTNSRIKSLMDWLIASLSSLFHDIPSSSTSSTKRWRRRPLVQIFGPKAQIDRGPAVAFNLYDNKGALIQPTVVQKLADRSSISLGCGCLSNLYLEEVTVTSGSDKENAGASTTSGTNKKRLLPEKCSSMAVFLDHSGGGAGSGSMKKLSDLPVLTATLGLVSNFEDVYRLWMFVAKFLEPEFMAGELLRYQSLNQSIVSLDDAHGS